MTTDASRLMRPGAVAAMEHSAGRLPASTAKLPGPGSPRVGQRDGYRHGCPYEGSSRMRGNSHVRFLGGRGRATARAYPATAARRREGGGVQEPGAEEGVNLIIHLFQASEA